MQDYATFETSLNTLEVDTYYMSLLDQVVELKEEVKDNQELIISLGNIQLLQDIRDFTETDIKNTIKDAITKTFGEEPTPEIKKIFDNALQQVAIA